jgi:hypothetical protein
MTAKIPVAYLSGPYLRPYNYAQLADQYEKSMLQLHALVILHMDQIGGCLVSEIMREFPL